MTVVKAPPFANEPPANDWYPHQRGVRIWRLASKLSGAGGAGTYLSDVRGWPVGSDLGDVKEDGDGIYVVDCPLGFTGRLLLNDNQEYEISPGMVIPDRYTRFRLIKLMSQSGNINQEGPYTYADCPVILATGPRGGEYRRPGRRVHLYRAATLGYSGLNIGAGVTAAATPRIWMGDYDAFGWYFAFTEAGPVDLGIVRTVSSPGSGMVGSLDGDFVETLDPAFTGVKGGTTYNPLEYYGPLMAGSTDEVGGLGNTLGAPNSARNPFWFGFMNRVISIQIKNRGAAAITASLYASGTIYVA